MKDLFISHASEDKDVLVRPLAETLSRMGVDVWYDEFSIRPGDSLSESIDRGLIECNYGLIIISPAFLQKKWTEYELKSLLTKEIHRGKAIIPVWHNVDFETVAQRSLFLADKKALNSSLGINKLAISIIREVRPDIINSFTLKETIKKLKPNGRIESRKISELKRGEIVHKTMPKAIVFASQMIASAFAGVMSRKEIVENFARDYDYDSEFLLWSIITASYWDTVYAIGYLPADEEMSKMLHALIRLSMGETNWLEESDLPDAMKRKLKSAYYKNAQDLFEISKNT